MKFLTRDTTPSRKRDGSMMPGTDAAIAKHEAAGKTTAETALAIYDAGLGLRAALRYLGERIDALEGKR